MGVLEIIIVLIVLLIAIPFISKMRKKCAPCSAKETCANEAETQQKAGQQAELQPDEQASAEDEPAAQTQAPEAAVVPPLEPQAAEPSAKAQTHAAAIALPENDAPFPQDSILKRHYLQHVSAMVETLAPPRPSDAVLCRHYDAMMLAKIDQCLNDKQAVEQLVDDYQNNKSVANVEAVATPKAAATAALQEGENNSALPQDSILKRHYLNHVCAMIAALVPQRPSDAVLCRHYDAMVTAKLDQCLSDKKAMAQLVSDYENRLCI